MKFEKLPYVMQNKEVKDFLIKLNKKRFYFIFKRLFDLVFSILLIIILIPLFIMISILIKLDSKGSIFYKQARVTRYYKNFRIIKFRTMVKDADKMGSLVTLSNDQRITKMGKFLRKYRLDELPQLFNILVGDMSFVGPRPEVLKYVEKYDDMMLATLLIRSGVTAESSIKYKDEDKLLTSYDDVDSYYVNNLLPEKMKYNLYYLSKISFILDLKIIFRTIFEVF